MLHLLPYTHPYGNRQTGWLFSLAMAIFTFLILAFITQPLLAQTTTFNATGDNQTYTLPADGFLTITARGGDGGGDLTPPGERGGSGATVSASFPMRQNDELIIVAGKGGIANNQLSSYGTPIGTVSTVVGGGGGGGSAVIVEREGTSTLLLVAGGGGGSDGIDGTRPGGGGTSNNGVTTSGSGTAAGGGFNFGLLNFFGGGGPGTLSGGAPGGGSRGGFGFGGGGNGYSSITLITATGEVFVTKSGGGGGGYGGGNGKFGPVGTETVRGYGGGGGSSFIQTAGFSPGNVVRTNGVLGGSNNQDGSVVLNFVPAPPLTINSFTVSDVICNGFNTGAISVNASGGLGSYTYTLSPGNVQNNTGNFTNLSAGIYSIAVSDGSNGSANTGNIIVNEPPALSFSTPLVTDVDCNGNSTGAIALVASGGTGLYSYQLNTGTKNNTGNFSGLAAGSYTISVTDGNGCTATTNAITVNEPPVLSVSISGNTSVIFGYGSNCTSLMASASGGTLGYSYAWSSGGTEASDQVCPGPEDETYTVIVTDGNGCQATKQVTVSVQDVRCGKKNDKVLVCHNGIELCISSIDVEDHLAHGDLLGSCGSSTASRIGSETEASTSSVQLLRKAYPNPAQDVVTVEVLSTSAGAGTFVLIDLMGREWETQTKELTEGLNTLQFQLGKLPDGMYIIRGVDTLNRQTAVRVVKKE